MQQHTGIIPKLSQKQTQLFRQLGDFSEWIRQPKDHSEIQKDQRKSVPQSELIKQIEKDFYTSLNQMAAHYQIAPIETKKLPFPNNLGVACWDMENKLKSYLKEEQELHLITLDWEQTSLGVANSYKTESSTYYVPIYSLFEMQKQKENKQTKDLLYSVYTYLYRVVGIPFYRDEDTYLSYMHEMLKVWLEEDGIICGEDEEYKKNILSEMAKVEYIGDVILKKINNENNLSFWKTRLDRFYIKNDFDKDLYSIAEKMYNLWQEYPNEYIFKYAQIDVNDDDVNDVLTMDKYLSFYCSFEGCLNEQINEMLNQEFGEYAEMENPVSYDVFNGKTIEKCNFDFLYRFFTLLTELLSLLFNN